MDNTTLTQPALNEGHLLDIKVYKKGRRCRHCNYPINMYTPGKYCNAHMAIGIKREMERIEMKVTKNIQNSVDNAKNKKIGISKLTCLVNQQKGEVK